MSDGAREIPIIPTLLQEQGGGFFQGSSCLRDAPGSEERRYDGVFEMIMSVVEGHEAA